ncbi:hypothetical protein CHS0354_006099 [Potamilus streckersoni]|uniref:Uncharacterized protein n=1 Tax=Potamilus streckersoni TaxID=2493646 RepID=A0AAE0STE6_9BIVA|nr:hypothetical protein CHS0354_006099 [Potamilus streckersoni]
MAGEASMKDDSLKQKEIKLCPTSIYKLRGDRLGKLKKNLNKKFEKVELNWDPDEYGFDVQFFAIPKESKCNLVNVMKSFINDSDKYVKTYATKTFILIAENCDDSLKGAFAICTGAAYHKVLPYVDTTFACSVARKILDPKSVAQLKCRLLNGQTIRIDKLFHKDRRGPDLPTVANESFFIAEGFQAQIKTLLDVGLNVLSRKSSSIKVTRFSLKIMKSLIMADMFGLLKDLLHVHLSNDYKDAEEFEFLNYVKPVKSNDLTKKLNHHLERYFLEESKVNRNGFFICHNKYEQWVKCEKVQLSKNTKQGKVRIKSWEGRPDISDIIDALGEEHRDWSSLQIRYKSKGKWWSDKFLNYIHGHVLYKRIYYFHIGKDWFKVDVEYIRRMDHTFFKLVKERLLCEKDEGYLPLPWCSEKYSNERINANHCIAFCENVLQRDLSKEDRTKINDIFLKSDRKSEHGQFLTSQDDEESRESLTAGNNGANAEEENEPPLPDSYDPVGEIEHSLSDDDDGDDDNDDDNGNLVQKKKQRSAYPRENRRKYDVSAIKSPLSKIIGEVECKLCLKSLTSRDEEKYNKMYYLLLNQFLEENPSSSLNKNLGVDPDNKFPTFLHGDKILVENVELFDILKITKDKLYLYHVKEGVGQKTRDAVSQIRISANLINKARESKQTQKILGKWYKQIMNCKDEDQTRLKLKEDFKKRKCSKDEFLNLFLKKKIVYVYAFLDDTKGRKPFNELVSQEQRLLEKEDIYKALQVKSQKRKNMVDVLCESLTSDNILAEKDTGFIVESKFLDRNTKELFQMFKDVGFSDRQADLLFHTLQKHFVPTVSIKSHIAKFELIRLAHDFNSSYPDFELRFWQIRKP